ncbi:MAG: hypothetical protein ACLQCU_00250 [Acidimicrobiales bacterium]
MTYETRPAGLAAQAARSSRSSTARSRREAVLEQAAEDDAEVVERGGKVTIRKVGKKATRR